MKKGSSIHAKTDDELAQILWDYNNLNQSLKKADAILVLGSNDVRVAQRGAELFLQDFAPLLIFAGNAGKLTKKLFDKPEAWLFAEEAIKMGVPKENILIEDKSTNTGENILYTKKLLEEKRIPVNCVILVQKPYMLRRAYATFRKNWPAVTVMVTSPLIAFDKYPTDLLSKELIINILVGDTQRVMVYPKKGFQIPQEMPDNVRLAYEELVARGYNKHLIK